MTFDVPDHLKGRFERAFAGREGNPIIAEFMREAVEQAERQQRRREAVASILERRARMAPVNHADVQAARDELRQ